MTTASPPPDNGPWPLRALRYLYRVPMLLWHLLVDLPLVVLLSTPPLANLPWGRGGERLGYRLIRAWSSGLLRIFGFRPHRLGTPLTGATLFVANHVSWVDIVALHSQHMMGFVAKREIAGWPLIGRMARRGETIFHHRGNAESLGGVLHEMLARLRNDRAVGMFPEGRTRDGHTIGPFHARLFLAAVEAGAQVQPVALRYGRAACAQTWVAFAPGESFVANFLRLLGGRTQVLEVCFLEPVDTAHDGGRRRIAEQARARIVEAMTTPT